jgi:DNA-binding MarR family transcriptional regulator
MTAKEPEFDLELFLPYLLNQAAETTSFGFHALYRDRYGMTRTQWRVLANIGKFGAMTARDICAISHIEKTKVSRAVAVLEREGMLMRSPSTEDRRVEILSLTDAGRAAFAELGKLAIAYDTALRERLGAADAALLDTLLRRLITLEPRGTVAD